MNTQSRIWQPQVPGWKVALQKTKTFQEDCCTK